MLHNPMYCSHTVWKPSQSLNPSPAVEISHYGRILPVFFVLKKYEPISRVLPNHSAFNIKQIDLHAMKKAFATFHQTLNLALKGPRFL